MATSRRSEPEARSARSPFLGDRLEAFPRGRFQHYLRLACRGLRAPAAAVLVHGGDRHLLLDALGLPQVPGLASLPPLTERLTERLTREACTAIRDAAAEPQGGEPWLAELGMVALAAAPLASSRGAVAGALCVLDSRPRGWSAEERAQLVDIAAAAATELQRHELELFHHHLVTASPLIAFRDASMDFCADYVSPNITALLGYTPEEIVGVPNWWPAHLHPDDREGAVRRQQRAARRGAPALVHEFRIAHREGGYRWYRGFVRFEYEAGGGAVGIWGFMQDIGEQKAAEVARRQYERGLRTLVENSPDIVARFDRELRHLYVNSAVRAASGLAPAAFLGRTNRELGMPEDAVRLWEASLREVLHSGRPRQIEFSYETPGGPAWFQSRLVPEFENEDEVASVLAVTRDLTDQKRAERERETLLRREREARREAERANHVKSEFLAVMSHELRTPLTAILGYSELLQLGIPAPLPSEAAAQVERIDFAAHHLLQLIEEILTFSRLEAGQEEVRRTEIDLRAVASGAVAFVLPQAERKGLDLSLRLPGHGVLAHTDEGKLRQVLVNLLSNAVKFTAEGTISLELEVQDGRACLHVEDVGLGIPFEHRESIFEPFWQIQQGNTREVSGTGLGLAVSRRLARMLGGEILVESEPGRGSRFSLVLPIPDSPESGSP